jgi:hypothetical protein
LIDIKRLLRKCNILSLSIRTAFSTAWPDPRHRYVEPQQILGGGQIGYNWQVNPAWVVGIEADFDGVTGGKKSMTSTLPGRATSSVCSCLSLRHGQVCWLGRIPSRRLPTSLARRFLQSERGVAQRSFTVELEEIEGIQRGLADGAAALPRLEVYGVAPPKTR